MQLRSFDGLWIFPEDFMRLSASIWKKGNKLSVHVVNTIAFANCKLL